jgi:hypothetical protein
MSAKSLEDLVMTALRKRPGEFLCGGCLALAGGLSLQDARNVMATMNTAPQVELRKEACSVCARTLDLVGIVPGARPL